MPTGLYTRWELDSKTGRFTPPQNKIRSFEKLVMSLFQRKDQNKKLEVFLQHADRKKVTALVLMGFILIATLRLKPRIAFTTSVPVRKYVLLSVKKIFNAVARREGSRHWDDTK